MISDTSLQLPAAHNMLSQDQVNSIDPLENQLCRVCDEKAAGFHFGAFTCEGCKSFFGRFCNNQTVIPDCKNNYVCVIDKRNRTSCKACRLKKCLSVGMSKSGCRYGRRSNWFKIHCLMQKTAAQKPSRPSLPQGLLVGSPPKLSHSALPRPLLAPQPQYSSVLKPPVMSSRSPSPLNTSLESSSTQSSPSPGSDIAPRVTPAPPLPPYFSHLATSSPAPLFDPLSLYRLSPLLALSSHLAAVQAQAQAAPSPLLGMDFKQTLDLLAERRALFEKLQSEAVSCSVSPTADTETSTITNENSVPVDLSVK